MTIYETLLYSVVVMMIISCKGDDFGETKRSNDGNSSLQARQTASHVGRILTNSEFSHRQLVVGNGFSAYFSSQTIRYILAQADVVGIRASMAGKNNERQVILVGFNKELKDVHGVFASSQKPDPVWQAKRQTPTTNGLTDVATGLLATKISFQNAQKLVTLYQKNNPAGVWASIFGEETIKAVLGQSDCAGVRFLLAKDKQGNYSLQLGCGLMILCLSIKML